MIERVKGLYKGWINGLILLIILSRVGVAGDYVYVVNYYDGTVSVIDLDTRVVSSTLSVGLQPSGIGVSKNTQRAYITDSAKPKIYYIDMTSNTLSGSFKVSEPCGGLAVGDIESSGLIVPYTNTGRSLYYVDFSGGTPYEYPPSQHDLGGTVNGAAFSTDRHFMCFSCIDDSTLQIFRAIGVSHIGAAKVGAEPNGIGCTVDSKYAFVANTLDKNNVSVVELSTATTVATIPVGTAPRDIAVAHEGNLAYVTNNLSGNISVVDTENFCTTSTIEIGGKPVAIVLSSDSETAYVTDVGENCVHIVDLKKNELVDSIPVGNLPIDIAIYEGSSCSNEL